MPSLPLLGLVPVAGEMTDWRRDASGNISIPQSTRIWIVVAAVAALLALGACIALVAVSISKRRLVRQQLKEARQRDPCLEQKEFSRRQRMTKNDLVLEAEGQRQAMIRKSLASRSGRSISTSSRLTLDQMSVAGRREVGSLDGYRMNDKRSWDGRPSRASSVSSLQRARSISPFPDMPAPTLSRPSSPNRLSQVLVGRPELPPLLEQHPLFQNMNEDSDLEDPVMPSLLRGRAVTKEG